MHERNGMYEPVPKALAEPNCLWCPNRLYYGETITKKQYGILMRCGEYFCIGRKRTRRFKRYEGMDRVPDWCPKRKSPCELRIYSLKSIREWFLHTRSCAQNKKAVPPSGSQCVLAVETHTAFAPQEFWERCNYEPYEDLLGVNLRLHEVAEIDDGLRPWFFYMTGRGPVPLYEFDTVAARKNKLEGSV